MNPLLLKSIFGHLVILPFAVAYTQVAASQETGTGPWPALSGSAATASTARTGYFNPAGLSRISKPESVLQLGYIHSEDESTDRITGLDLTREEEESDDFFIPAYYYARPLAEDWGFGLSIVAPAGFGDDYGDNSISRYLATEWSLVYVSVNPSISYKLSDQWSVGATLSINYVNYSVESKVLNLDSPGTNDGDLELEADDIATVFNVGVLYQHSERTRVGLIYRQGAEAELEAEPDFSNLGNGTTKQLIESANLEDINIDIESQLPDIVNLGFYHEFENGSALTADLAWIGFSDFVLTEFTVLEGTPLENKPEYDDIFAGSIGFSYPWNSRLTIGIGVGMIENPVDDRERSLLFRIDEAWVVGAGVEYKISDARTLVANFHYGEVGDGRVESAELPILGKFVSDYDQRNFFALDMQYRWH